MEVDDEEVEVDDEDLEMEVQVGAPTLGVSTLDLSPLVPVLAALAETPAVDVPAAAAKAVASPVLPDLAVDAPAAVAAALAALSETPVVAMLAVVVQATAMAIMMATRDQA